MKDYILKAPSIVEILTAISEHVEYIDENEGEGVPSMIPNVTIPRGELVLDFDIKVLETPMVVDQATGAVTSPAVFKPDFYAMVRVIDEKWIPEIETLLADYIVDEDIGRSWA